MHKTTCKVQRPNFLLSPNYIRSLHGHNGSVAKQKEMNKDRQYVNSGYKPL